MYVERHIRKWFNTAGVVHDISYLSRLNQRPFTIVNKIWKINADSSIGYVYLVVIKRIIPLQKESMLLPCQPRVTVTPYFVYKAIWELKSVDHLSINPYHRIGLIHMWSLDSLSSSGVYKLMFNLTIVN